MPTTWTNTSGNSTSWTNGHYDFYNIWDEWDSYTWGSVSSSGYTWGYLSGLTFNNASTNTSTWVSV